MRRPVEESEGSLDLLLDTICNMFGGIVLIAILLAVVSQFSARVSRQVRQEQAREGVTKAEWQQQGQRIALLQQNIVELEKQTSRSRPAAEKEEESLDALAKLLKALQSENDRLSEEQREAAARLAEIRAMLSEEGGGTEGFAMESEGTPVFCAVKFGRFFAIHDVWSKAYPRTRSERQVALLPQANGSVMVRLKKEEGQAVSQGCELRGAIQATLENIKPDREFLDVVVYPDSYASFGYLLKVIKKNGLGYSWLPLPDGEEIEISSSAGGKRKVMKLPAPVP